MTDPPDATQSDICGSVETSVRRDLARLGELDDGARGSLAAMALRLAQAYDRYDGADMAKLARLNQELRQTLAAVVEVRNDGDGDEDAAALSTPEWAPDVPAAVRDAAEPGAADVGRPGGGGGAAAG